MAALRINFLAIAAVAVLSGCGGGGGDGGTTPPAGSNGLPFGSNGQNLSDAEGVNVVAEGASFAVGSGPAIGPATIRVNAGFFGGGGATNSLDGTLQIFGETVTITNGVGTLSTNEEVRLIFEPDRVGTYVAAVDAAVSDVTGGTINGGGAYVFGFETSPSAMSGLSGGTTTYTGGFQTSGSFAGSTDTETEYEGGITIVADFGSSVDVTLDGTFDGTTNMDLSNGSIPISGNGFSGGLSCDLGCSGTGSAISGTFYGPNADEVGGVLSIDVTVGGQTYDGVGTFIIVLPTSS